MCVWTPSQSRFKQVYQSFRLNFNPQSFGKPVESSQDASFGGDSRCSTYIEGTATNIQRARSQHSKALQERNIADVCRTYWRSLHHARP
jgi:hypothetical protein